MRGEKEKEIIDANVDNTMLDYCPYKVKVGDKL